MRTEQDGVINGKGMDMMHEFMAVLSMVREGTLALLLLGSMALGQTVTFQGLGDLPGGEYWSEARGVAIEGYAVVGASKSYTDLRDAFRWLPGSGIERLGDLPQGASQPQPWGASADATIVVGYMSFPEGGDSSTYGYSWTASEGFFLLPYLHADSTRAYANGVSSDGSVIVGIEQKLTDNQAVRWHVGDSVVVESLGYLPGGNYSQAWAVSADGSCTVGYGKVLDAQEAFRCVDDGPMEGLGDLPGGIFKSFAKAVSQDGSVIVGYGTTAEGSQAFRWDESNGMVGLGQETGSAEGVSGDGSVIVGNGRGEYRVFIWDADNGTR
ncbi:MAG: hypothetical protein JXD22_02590, partial [Sedimentisphaerales bacterium]|nr:hypothetical protein [Sedimentisphaerales bacterium]